MKKILTTFILLSILSSTKAVCADATETIILQPTDTALLFFNERPLEIKVSNPDIVKAQNISSIFEEDSKITVEALDFGTGNLTVKTKNNNFLYKIKVQEKAPQDRSMLLDTLD